MSWRIGKSFGFDAAHHLPSLPATHKCARPHGHTYRVEVVLTSTELTGPGFVTDFGDLAPLGDFVKAQLDHRDLNEVLDFEPTSELIAAYLARWVGENLDPVIGRQLHCVRVSETPSTWAEFRPGG